MQSAAAVKQTPVLHDRHTSLQQPQITKSIDQKYFVQTAPDTKSCLNWKRSNPREFSLQEISGGPLNRNCRKTADRTRSGTPKPNVRLNFGSRLITFCPLNRSWVFAVQNMLGHLRSILSKSQIKFNSLSLVLHQQTAQNSWIAIFCIQAPT